YSVTLTLNPGRAGLPVTVLVNGETFLAQELPNRWQDYTFSVDAAHPQALASRDLVIELRVPAGRRMLLDRVRVGAAGPGFVQPALAQLGYVALIVLGVYLLLGRIGF